MRARRLRTRAISSSSNHNIRRWYVESQPSFTRFRVWWGRVSRRCHRAQWNRARDPRGDVRSPAIFQACAYSRVHRIQLLPLLICFRVARDRLVPTQSIDLQAFTPSIVLPPNPAFGALEERLHVRNACCGDADGYLHFRADDRDP